jgi:putative ABC transport system permease protein
MAVGASPGAVLRLVIGGGLKLVVAGLVIGCVASVALGGVLRAMLYEVEPLDVTSYVATAALLFVVALVACLVPARRAMRVDPVIAMQE